VRAAQLSGKTLDRQLLSEQLLITGIPGSGKSSFGRWLRDNRGFFFVDMEAEPKEPDSLDSAGLRPTWEEFTAGENRMAFVREIQSKKPFVLDWGFPLGCSNIVLALIHAGIDAWWFEGDRITAREHYLKRNTHPVIDFDIQFANIAGNWELVRPMFGNRVIRVALADGSLLSPPKILEAMAAV
jgi:hypothetical protein